MSKLIFSFLIILISTVGYAQIPVFPEAQGSGTFTKGGRGGTIIEVTNLNNSGPGSLRAALEATYPRIVVFKVAGTIKILSQLQIRNPFITIAGQTAPGGGILISAELMDDDAFYIFTNNVVIRYIKIRAGRGASAVDQLGDCIGIGYTDSKCFNIVIDHCSLSWGNDEISQIWVNRNANGGTICKNITFSYNIFSEPLNYGNHAFGAIAGSNHFCDSLYNIDFQHNLFIHSRARNTQMRIASFRFINNIVYNGAWYTQIEGGIHADIAGNLYKKRVNHDNRAEYLHGVNRDPSIYFAGNIGPNNADSKADNWGIMDEISTTTFQYTGNRIPLKYKRNVLLPQTAGQPIIPQEVSQLESTMLNSVGAFQRIEENGSWTGNRDAVDIRLMNEYSTGTGATPKDETSVGGFPTISSGIAYLDTDKDGMADEWEKRYCFNPNDATDGNKDFDGDGYTNVEEFLNGSVPTSCLITGLAEDDSKETFSISPNPAKSELFISGNLVENATYEITSIQGKSLQTGNVNAGNIYIGNLKTGLFLLKIKKESGESVQRFVKE